MVSKCKHVVMFWFKPMSCLTPFEHETRSMHYKTNQAIYSFETPAYVYKL